jgi:hypothetical protein
VYRSQTTERRTNGYGMAQWGWCAPNRKTGIA